MVDNMQTKRVCQRIQTFTTKTAHALSHILRGLVDVTKYLLQSGHDFVMLGDFSSDQLERAFSKLRQGSWRCLLYNSAARFGKAQHSKYKILLQLDVNFIDVTDGHLCSGCNRNLTDKECEIFDNLTNLEASLSEDNECDVSCVCIWLQYATTTTNILRPFLPLLWELAFCSP